MKCYLCKGIIKGHGNNPAPLDNGKNKRCCDTCNATKVIPARMMILMEK